MHTKLFLLLTFILFSLTGFTQDKIIDEIIAVVGNNPIKQSDIISLRNALREESGDENFQISDCELLEQLLFQKLLIHQSYIDSVEIPEKQVEQELDRRLRYYTMKFGSEEKLEEFYGKSIGKIKEEFREPVRDQLLSQTMQGRITGGLTVTPAEIRNYYNNLPTDSIPFINAEVEVGRLMKIPPVSEETKKEVRERLEKLRERILAGTDFASMAALYSEDPGSAAKGGELGFMQRGQLVPEFETAAFELKQGEVSRVIETLFGYHIIQLIERRGETFNARHILLIPKTNTQDLLYSQKSIDSAYSILKTDTIKFEVACARYSDDKDTKYNGGLIINPNTGNTRFEMDELDQQVFFSVDKLSPGQYTAPMPYQSPDGKKAFQILYLKSKTEPHVANLKDDYQRIQNAALSEKQNKVITEWIKKKRKNTYIQLDEKYKNCKFKHPWI